MISPRAESCLSNSARANGAGGISLELHNRVGSSFLQPARPESILVARNAPVFTRARTRMNTTAVVRPCTGFHSEMKTDDDERPMHVPLWAGICAGAFMGAVLALLVTALARIYFG